MASRKRKAPPAPVAQRIATRQGILLELDALPGDSGVNLSHADFVKDGTGVGQVWQAATDILCDFLESFPSVVDVPSVLELGAGVGVPGLLAARLGARRVVLTDYQPHVLARLRQNVAANQLERACAVEHLSWGELPDSAERYQLLMGADLAATSGQPRSWQQQSLACSRRVAFGSMRTTNGRLSTARQMEACRPRPPTAPSRPSSRHSPQKQTLPPPP